MAKFGKGVGVVVISLGVIQGMLGIGFFCLMCSNIESDKVLHNKNTSHPYEVRIFNSNVGDALFSKYIFETYRIFDFIPIEKKVGETDFIDTEARFDLGNELQFAIVDSSDKKQYLAIKSLDGNQFVKELK